MGIQFKKSVLEMLILSLIHQGDYTAFQIEETLSTTIKIPEGSIYPILRKLITDHYVYTRIKQNEDLENKKYYYLTDEGITYFTQLNTEWNDLTSRINGLLKEKNHD